MAIVQTYHFENGATVHIDDSYFANAPIEDIKKHARDFIKCAEELGTKAYIKKMMREKEEQEAKEKEERGE